MKAVIYARYSTENQGHETIEVQVEKCAAYATEHDIEIVEIFADEAVSGMKSQRPELQKLFDMAELKLFNYVLIYDQSRFSRDIVDWFTFRHKMQNNDIQIISVTQPYVGGDLNDTAVFATEGINALVNQMHVLQTRQKVVEAMNHMARQALHTGGSPLLGYDIVDKKYVLNDYEAEIVRLIFTLYSQGKSYRYIIELLNQKGYKTKFGKTFGKNSLSTMLRNEKYIGNYIYNKIPPAKNGKRNSHAINPKMIRIENAVPKIISNDTWDLVQKRLNSSKHNARNNAKAEYLLSGKVICGKCHKAMIGQCSNYHYYFYVCSGRQRLRNCDKKNINKELLEKSVAEIVKSTLATENQRKEIANALFEQQCKLKSAIDPATASVKKRILEVQHRIDNINRAISEGVWSTSTASVLKQLEKEQQDLYIQLSSTEKTKISVDHTLNDILDTLAYISQLDIEEEGSKKILLAFVDKVIVNEETIDVILNPLKKEIPSNIEMSDGTFMNGAGDRT